jgi:membrane-associated protein
MHFDLFEILRSFGPYATAIILMIVFAESGLFFGFFLPGDSLLFSAGFLASQGFMNIWVLCIGCFIAAVLGDSVGYWFGDKYGKRMFTSDKSWLFNKAHITNAEEFYKKHGKKTIILARFVPAVRTFAPIVAGIGSMEYKTFLSYNLVGGFLWAVGMTLGGYFLGSLMPADKVEKYLLLIIGVIVFISIVPVIVHYFQEKSAHKAQ